MSKEAPVDFSSLDVAAATEKSYELELAHPYSKAPLGVFVSVIGAESPAFKSRLFKEINRDRKKEFEARRKGKEAEPSTIEEDEANSVSLVCDLVVGWRTVLNGKSEPVIYWAGEKLDFNPDNVRRWLARFSWARAQINEAANDLGNFLSA